MIAFPEQLEKEAREARMPEPRDVGRPARRRGIVAASALAALALALALAVGAPPASGVPVPGPAGPDGAASLGAGVSGLAFDPGGRLYAADLPGDRVVVLGAGDEVLATLGAGRLDRPTGVAVARAATCSSRTPTA